MNSLTGVTQRIISPAAVGIRAAAVAMMTS
jgi:hypothetical protein